MNVSTSTVASNRRRIRKQANEAFANPLNSINNNSINNNLNNMEEENTGYLKFGDEFKLIQVNHNLEEEMLTCLNLSEARLIIRESLLERHKLMKNIKNQNNKKDDDENADFQFEQIFSNAQSQEQELENIDKLLEYSTGYTNSVAIQAGSSSPTQQQQIKQQQQQTGNNNSSGYENQALRQTLIYLANFARYRDSETVATVRQLLSNVETQDLDYNAKNIHNIDTTTTLNPNNRNTEAEREKELLGNQLHPFEIAQMASLSCVEADEAKTLIPSLNKKLHDADLERILSELNELETLY
ncbi:uncharacterized protein HGUI_01322 [Hanseniaspora guilliermondii]|uniref:RNA polymerase Rpb4/RPC9 core domain-containing protein n=1 Tax=Hanseniaspora guilliermondii TaxID=56406 RepID=A0A1L0AYB0_9ASCO|nr:uncharacterized protein HGUI_01322 [Hanseniaspora guilliermondii]